MTEQQAQYGVYQVEVTIHGYVNVTAGGSGRAADLVDDMGCANISSLMNDMYMVEFELGDIDLKEAVNGNN